MTRLVYLKLLSLLCGRWLGEMQGSSEGLSAAPSGWQMRALLNRMEVIERKEEADMKSSEIFRKRNP